MASEPEQTPRAPGIQHIEIAHSLGPPIKRSALKCHNISTNYVTQAEVKRLGYRIYQQIGKASVRRETIWLTWGPTGLSMKTWKSEFHIVERAEHDIMIGSVDLEKLLDYQYANYLCVVVRDSQTRFDTNVQMEETIQDEARNAHSTSQDLHAAAPAIPA